MAEYTKTHISHEGRTELHDLLNLTGAEISVNTLPAGGFVPFTHSHKKNEEIYGIISGKGLVEIDGEKVELEAGDWIKIAPRAHRQFFAAADSELFYICVQVEEGSLSGYSATDAVAHEE